MDAAAPIPQLFGIVPAGSPLLITPTGVPSPTSYVYTITVPPAPSKPFTHLTVFLLPGIALPPATAAAVYLAVPQAPTNFRFLGAIGENKESAVFKISGWDNWTSGDEAGTGSGLGFGSVPEVVMDPPEIGVLSSLTREIVIGISIEPAEAVAVQLANLQAAAAAKRSALGYSCEPSSALTLVDPTKSNPLVLAQRIIKDAFNFLASHGSSTGAGEFIPLKAFEEWWRKFEGKIKRDPGFLEKDRD